MEYRAKDVKEAIRMAEGFKIKGIYDWFRGQKYDWPLISSYLRLNKDEIVRAEEEIKFFEYWIKNEVEVPYITSNYDHILGVGQHYGLKTNFLDFTTDPKIAGFFATECKNKDTSESVIICLNTSELEEYTKIIGGKVDQFRKPEFLTLDIPNLWRMQAQKGVFLFFPYLDFEEKLFTFDRILFPYDGKTLIMDRSKIYPKEKSELELLLEQFFENIKIHYAKKEIRKIISNEYSLDEDAISNPYKREFFKHELDVYSGWNNEIIKQWKSPKIQNYSEVLKDEKFAIKIDFSLNIGDVKQEISKNINECVKIYENIRNHSGCWKVNVANINNDNTSKASEFLLSNIEEYMANFWDATRILPYNSIDLMHGLINLCVIFYSFIKENPFYREDKKFWNKFNDSYFGKSIIVEYQNFDKSYSRSYISINGLSDAIRDDINKYIIKEMPRLEYYLLAYPNPRKLFDFKKFVQIYIKQVLPTQIIMRNERLLFNPVYLQNFGRP